MKRILFGLGLGVLLLGLGGCIFESDTEDDPDSLRFENLSSQTISVVSQTTEWGGFELAPGQVMELQNIENVDYYFVPSTSVQLGSASSERDVVFVNSPPSDL